MMNDDLAHTEPATNYALKLEAEFAEESSLWLAFIKKQPNAILEANRTLASQLQVVELGEGSPLETLHSLLHHSISPYVRSYVKSRSQKTEDAAGKSTKSGEYI